MTGDDDGGALGFQPPDGLNNLLLAVGIQSCGGFVHQHQAIPGQEQSTQRQAPGLTTG